MIDPSLTQTIRQYCDGELSPSESQAFERQLEANVKLQQAVVFERNLRKRLDAVLSADSTKAPATLAERIRASLAEDSAPAPLKIEQHREAAHVNGVHHPTWRINYLAVAAVLTLVAGAVIFGIVFPQIDTIQTAPSDVSQTELLATIGNYVSDEHDRVAGDRTVADDKLFMMDLNDAASELSQALKSRVLPIDLSAIGYTFYGGATCGALPCGGPSGHMLYKKQKEDGSFTGPNISLFFVPEGHLADALDFKLRRQWVKNNEKSKQCGHQVHRLDYPDTGLVYFLVTCDPRVIEDAKTLILEQLHAASPTGSGG